MTRRATGPTTITVGRTAKRLARTTIAAPQRASTPGPARVVETPRITISLDVSVTEHHQPGSRPSAAAPASVTGQIAVLLRHAEAHSATIVEDQLAVPTNIGRNYYDAGHDFDVTNTTRVTFASARDANAFLLSSQATLVGWLQRRRCQSAVVHVGGLDLPPCDEQDLQRASVLLGFVGRDS